MYKIVKGNDVTNKETSDFDWQYLSKMEDIEKICFKKSKQSYKKIQDDLSDELRLCTIHPLIYSAHVAFAQHKNLEIHPEDIHLLVTHQIGTHINLNSEKYKNLFTKSDEKKKLIVVVPIDVIDNKKEFSKTIYKFCDKMDLDDSVKEFFESDFSESSDNIKLCSKMSLMETASKFYDYGMLTMCGIPEFHIYGTTEDWIKLKKKIQILDKIDLGLYKKKLENFIDEVLKSFTTDNNKFWINFYKYTEKNDYSGSFDAINGHILKLFWYINKKRFIKSENFSDTIPAESLLTDFKVIDIDWLCMGNLRKFKLVTGFMGVSVNSKIDSVKPVTSWILYECPFTSQSSEKEHKTMV
jgi:hypothetical protein